MAIDVVMPILGLDVEKAVIAEWYKKEGDPVQKGEPIFCIEVEKVTTDVESPATGILAKILIPLGKEVPLLTVVAVIAETGEDISEYLSKLPEPPVIAAETKVVDTAIMETPSQGLASQRGTIRAVPAAKKLAKDQGIDLTILKGTGPGGVILVKDVEKARIDKRKQAVKVSTLARRLAEKESISIKEIQGTGVRGRVMRNDLEAHLLDKTAKVKSGIGAVIPMTSVRRTIARRMAESAFTAPHIYFFSEVWIDPLLALRQELLLDFEKRFHIRLSINDFLIKAVALNILDFPILNARINEDTIQIMPEVNVGLAVAMEEGLLVPAIVNADRSSLVEIARQRSELVARAREGNLSLEEMGRGTFTLSSLAQYDITHFTAILNPPQSGILSVGKTDEKLVMVNGQVKVNKVARFGLSVDHRIIDGAKAADFLQNLKWKLERPSLTFCCL